MWRYGSFHNEGGGGARLGSHLLDADSADQVLWVPARWLAETCTIKDPQNKVVISRSPLTFASHPSFLEPPEAKFQRILDRPRLRKDA